MFNLTPKWCNKKQTNVGYQTLALDALYSFMERTFYWQRSVSAGSSVVNPQMSAKSTTASSRYRVPAAVKSRVVYDDDLLRYKITWIAWIYSALRYEI